MRSIEELLPDIIAASVGAVALTLYHIWLVYMVIRHPAKTVFGLGSASRRIWIASIMYRKQEILAVQTIRNSLMACQILATTSVALIFGVSTFVSNVQRSTAGESIIGFTLDSLFGWKVTLLLLAHIMAFFYLSQSIRFYNHVCVNVNVNITEEELAKLNDHAIVAYHLLDANHMGDTLNRGAMFYTMAMRMYYLSFPILAWFAGPWTLVASVVLLLVTLRFIDFNVPKDDMAVRRRWMLCESIVSSRNSRRSGSPVSSMHPVEPVDRSPASLASGDIEAGCSSSYIAPGSHTRGTSFSGATVQFVGHDNDIPSNPLQHTIEVPKNLKLLKREPKSNHMDGMKASWQA